MTTSDFLGLVDGARSIGASRWLARCPSHDDQRPSLSIREGEKAILLRCWAGCDLHTICSSLGIEAHQLFYDSGKPADRETLHQRQMEKSSRYDWRRDSQEKQTQSALLFLESEKVLSKVKGLDVSGWTNEDFSKAWQTIEDPLRKRIEADRLQDESFLLRSYGLQSEKHQQIMKPLNAGGRVRVNHEQAIKTVT